MSETPRVDMVARMVPDADKVNGRFVYLGHATELVSAEFARQLERELAQAQARLADVEKDAARLDWLERENPIVFHKTRSDDVWTLCVGVRHDNDGKEIEGKTLRAAIDAALKEPR